MKNLIEALQIFLKYGDVNYPFHCEHDILYVHGYDPHEMSKEDIDRLDELGFYCKEESEEDDSVIGYMDHFESYKYGSC